MVRVRVINIVLMALFAVAAFAANTRNCTVAQNEAPSAAAVPPTDSSPFPKGLQRRATIEFNSTPLTEVAAWIREQSGIDVLIDETVFSQSDVPIDIPVSKRLENEPLHHLLDDLSDIGLGWYVEHDILHISTDNDVQSRRELRTYRVVDLLNDGCDPHALIQAVVECTGGSWEISRDGEGTIELFGGLLYVTQNRMVHENIAEFLSLVRKPNKEPQFLNDPGIHRLMPKLDQLVTVDFQRTPIGDALDVLTMETGVKFVYQDRYVPDTVTSLSLKDKKLSVVLDVMHQRGELSWMPYDDGIIVDDAGSCGDRLFVGVFDVSDICASPRDSRDLFRLLKRQTSGLWECNGDGDGTIEFLRPGLMVVMQAWHVHLEIMQLLADIREQLTQYPDDRMSIFAYRENYTQFYKLPSPLAEGLITALPQFVEPETWKSTSNPHAVGKIHLVASDPVPELVSRTKRSIGELPSHVKEDPPSEYKMVPHSVLIIHQDRDVHVQIQTFIERTKTGDWTAPHGFMPGMGYFHIR